MLDRLDALVQGLDVVAVVHGHPLLQQDRAAVDRALECVDDFNRDFQRLVTQYGWGETWGDPTLSPRERSILNLGMIAALGKMQEFETHTRGALRNGLTPDEVRAVLTQITAYCGMPVGVDCFRVARKVIDEHKK